MTPADKIPVSSPDVNAAPIEPIVRHYRPDPPSSQLLDEFIAEKIERFKREHMPVKREMHYAWEYITNFIEGRQNQRRSHLNRGWRVVGSPKTTNAPIETLPKLGFYSRQMLSRWVAANTQCDVFGEDDSDESQSTARAGAHILKWLESVNYTPKFRQSEALNGQTTGAYARYFYYDKDADDAPLRSIPITQQVQQKIGEDIFECYDCQNADSQSSLLNPYATSPESIEASRQTPMCPQCLSPRVRLSSAPVADVQQVTGERKEKAGRVRAVQVSLFELMFDLCRPLEESLFLGWERMLRLEEIQARYPNLDIQAQGFTDNTGLASAYRLSTSSVWGNGLTNDSSFNADRVAYSEWWLAPQVYANYRIPVRTECVDGTVLEAGEKLIDRFPDGVCAVFLPGQRILLALYPERAKDHWVSAPYHFRLLSGIGYGIGETVEAQRQWNLIMAQVFQQIRQATTPAILADADAIEPGEARRLGLPGEVVFGNTGSLPEGKSIRDAVYELQSQPLASHVPWYLSQVDGLMQTGTDAIAFSSAIPGVNNKTATGAQLGAGLASSQTDPEHQLKANADERSGFIMLELFRKNCPDPVFIPGIGKQAIMEGQYFSAADLQTTIQVRAKEGSWRSRSDFEQQESFQKAINILAAWGGPEMAPPAIVSQVGELFGVKFDTETYSSQERLCRIRLDRAKKMLPMAQRLLPTAPTVELVPNEMGMLQAQAIDPAQWVAQQLAASIQPEICPEEPGHMESINYLRRCFLTDELIYADSVYRAVVKAMIHMHVQAYAQEGMLANQVGAIVNPAPMPTEEAQPKKPGQVKKTDQQKRNDQARANMRPGQAGKPALPKGDQ